MKRREFIKNSAGISVLPYTFDRPIVKRTKEPSDTVRCALIGVGARGLGTLSLLLNRADCKIVALCDIDETTLSKGLAMVKKAGQVTPKIYSGDEWVYRQVLERDDIDAVFICTPWRWHTPMSCDAMSAGIAVACEVAGETSIESCWKMVRTYEATKTPFMIMENVCYRRDIMAVLNMVRQGMFGALIHLEGGYQHDLREVKFNDGKQYYGGGVEFGEQGYSEARWRTLHSLHRNGDLYPTHGLGPLSVMLDINKGNRLEYLVSMASKSAGLHDYIINHPKGGKNHPNAHLNFHLGDVVTTMIKTVQGQTILLTHDTNLPRPYSLGFRVQGTKGLWMDVHKSLYIEGISDPHSWQEAQSFIEKYDHPLWHKYHDKAVGAGHGGMDYFVLNAFVEALKNNHPMPLDVYDHATWAAVTCLSEQSIAHGGAPQYFPDFTQGAWMDRKSIFALHDNY